MKDTLEAVLTINNREGALLESVEIVVPIPEKYAVLLVEGDDKFSDALEADLKEFLWSKWNTLAPIVKRLNDRRGISRRAAEEHPHAK